MKKLLVSGCSFTAKHKWPSLLFAPKEYHVLNLGCASAGNNYISNSIIYNADQKPDFVFVLWSGINRSDFRVPNSGIFEKISTNSYRSRVIGDSRYFVNGHAVDPEKGWLAGYNDIKTPDWPEITCLKDWFDLPEYIKLECLRHKIYLSSASGQDNQQEFCHHYYLTQHLGLDNQYRSELTFQNMFNCFNLLDQMRIPYRFSFIYDIFADYHNTSLGQARKVKYYHYIDWDKYIDLPTFEYGIKHDLLDSDQFHLTESGMNQWAVAVSKLLREQKDLQYLYDE